jgi:ABC-2 type transport system ATP-binding protein
MIQVTDLRKAYGSVVAVDGISFEVHRGETFGLLGPNGAGKTTTIHILAGALRPDAGVVVLSGEPDPTRPEVRRQLGFAPQALSLYPELTAQENLVFFGKLYGLHGAHLKERVDGALELAGLTDRRSDRVSGYSGGMKRRLNLACALVHDPAVVLLDEPTAGVDPQSRNHLFESVEALAREGRTILYTTHYMEEAERLCDRVAIMDRGKILALDTVDALLARHGGQAVVEAELEQLPTATAALPGRLDGNHLRIETDRPLELLVDLAARGVKPVTFRVDRPVLGLRVGNPALLALAIVSLAVCFVGLMMLMSTIGTTEAGVAGAGWGIMMPMAMLGGGMIPLIAMPPWLFTASNFSPVKWGIYSLEGAIWRGFPLAEMLPWCGLLVGVGVVSFALGVRLLARRGA